MKWSKIAKSSAPTTGTYRNWKSHLADEADYQCVYCAIHEAAFGGFRNFHVEHLRPKSIYPSKEDDYFNLFYACAICNTFKGDDWPNNSPQINRVCYPDPSVVDYSSILDLRADGVVVGLTVAGRYVVERLFLNRPQLIQQRRMCRLRDELRAEWRSIESMLDELLEVDPRMVLQATKEFSMLLELQDRHHELRPYLPSDVTR